MTRGASGQDILDVFGHLLAGLVALGLVLRQRLADEHVQGGRQTGHGFRAAFSTWANEAGADPTVIELCLAHQQGGVRGIYNRGGYVAQRKKLLDAWGKHLLAQGLRLP